MASARIKTCPKCRQPMRVPTNDTQPHQAVKCPHCAAVLRIQPKGTPRTEAQETNQPLSVLPAPTTTQQHSREAYQGEVPPMIPPQEVSVHVPPMEDAPQNNTHGPLPAGGTDSGSLSLLTNPRWLRRLLYYGIWLGPVAGLLSLVFLAALTPTDPDRVHTAANAACSGICLAIMWFPMGYLLGRFGSWGLTMLLVKDIKCPGCGELYPAVDRWACGCGYTPPVQSERHILATKCPLCQKSIGWIVCQACETTIMVQ